MDPLHAQGRPRPRQATHQEVSAGGLPLPRHVHHHVHLPPHRLHGLHLHRRHHPHLLRHRHRHRHGAARYDDLVAEQQQARDADRVQSGAIAIAPGPRLGSFVVRPTCTTSSTTSSPPILHQHHDLLRRRR